MVAFLSTSALEEEKDLNVCVRACTARTMARSGLLTVSSQLLFACVSERFACLSALSLREGGCVVMLAKNLT